MRRALVLVILIAGCRRGAETPARPQPRPRPVAATRTSEDWDELPPREAYAGSASCRECHEKNYERWSHDWHSRALSEAAPRNVEGRFDRAHYRGQSSEAWMLRRGDRYVMRTRDREGRLGDYEVDWVIGGKRMQDTVTVLPDGRWQILPVYFHVTGGGAWVDYNEAKQGKVAPDHPFFWTNFRRTANKECLDCHTTGLDARYDRAEHRWTTSFADPGVACEACHGPGARHAETKAKADIVHPGHLAKDLAFSICARCHGPREPLYPLLDARFRLRPGQRYDDRYQPLVVVDGRERSGEYFADGRPSSSSYEYQALLQSACYRSGGATCLTCHAAPHGEHGPDELRGDADASCRKCHAPVVAQGEAHTHHQSAKGASCTGCHMPHVVSGVLDKFADHAIDVPNAGNTIRHGVPNACGVCHASMPAADAAKTIARWWPDAGARQGRRTRLADAIDEQTAAGSRDALIEVLRDGAEAPTLRGAAALLLAQRFPAEAAQTIVRLLGDRSEVARAKFLEALGFAEARGSADAVAGFTGDPSLQVRQMAALVLASFRDPRAEPALRKLASDPATAALFRPHVMLSIAAGNRGDYDGALREIDAALAEAPYVGDAIVFRADLLARRGDLRAARAELEEALRFDPRHRGALARLRQIPK